MKNQDKIKEFYNKLEKIGLEQVKIDHAQSVYGTEEKCKLVQAWINLKEDTIVDQHKKRNTSIAEEANQIALTSNKISWISLMVSIITLISSLVAIFK